MNTPAFIFIIACLCLLVSCYCLNEMVIELTNRRRYKYLRVHQVIAFITIIAAGILMFIGAFVV